MVLRLTAGDIVVVDANGVVVVPRVQAAEVLTLGTGDGLQGAFHVRLHEKLRSIEEAVKNSGVCRRWHWLGGGRQPYLLAEKGRTV
jgi:regulator of RNase E activity RraA